MGTLFYTQLTTPRKWNHQDSAMATSWKGEKNLELTILGTLKTDDTRPNINVSDHKQSSISIPSQIFAFSTTEKIETAQITK